MVTLPHPSSHAPSHYLLHSVSGLHEIKRVTYPLSVPRSWLITPDTLEKENSNLTIEPGEEEGEVGKNEKEEEEEEENWVKVEQNKEESVEEENWVKVEQNKEESVEEEGKVGTDIVEEGKVEGGEVVVEDMEEEKWEERDKGDWLGQGQVVPDSSLYICTPIDPLFLFVEHLTTLIHYLPLDDIMDPLIETSPHWSKVLESGTNSEALIKSRIRSICDQVDAGGEPSYRLSKSKLLKVFTRKCKAIIAGNELPGTMEEEFVRKVLAKPIGSDSACLAEGENEKANVLEEGNEPTQQPTAENSFDGTTDSQKLQNPIVTQEIPSSTNTTAPPIPPDIAHLQRIRVASQYLSSYLSPALAKEFSAHLETTHDFTPLDKYLSDLAKLKQELSFYRAGNFSMQTSIDEQEGRGNMSKKRKREEEEEQEKKRKKNLSTGVRNLAKVDTKGMAKMTNFFKKKY